MGDQVKQRIQRIVDRIVEELARLCLWGSKSRSPALTRGFTRLVRTR
jgi:hypothetical protein